MWRAIKNLFRERERAIKSYLEDPTVWLRKQLIEPMAIGWINIETWTDSAIYLDEQADLLLTDEAERVLTQLIAQYEQNPHTVQRLQMHLEILQHARQKGVAAAFAGKQVSWMVGLPTEAQQLVEVGEQAQRHYLQTSDVRYLDQAIQLWEQLLNHPHFDQWPDQVHLIIYGDGATSYLCRFRAKGQRVDLDRAITLYKTVVQTIPSGYPALPFLLNSLGGLV